MKRVINVLIIATLLIVIFPTSSFASTSIKTSTAVDPPTNWKLTTTLTNSGPILNGDSINIHFDVKNIGSTANPFELFVSAYLPTEMELNSFSSSDKLYFGTWPKNSAVFENGIQPDFLNDRQPLWATSVGTFLGDNGLESDGSLILQPNESIGFDVSGIATSNWTSNSTEIYSIISNPKSMATVVMESISSGQNPFKTISGSYLNTTTYSYSPVSQNATSTTTNSQVKGKTVLKENAVAAASPLSVASTQTPTFDESKTPVKKKIALKNANLADRENDMKKSESIFERLGGIWVLHKNSIVPLVIALLASAIIAVKVNKKRRNAHRVEKEYQHALIIMRNKHDKIHGTLASIPMDQFKEISNLEIVNAQSASSKDNQLPNLYNSTDISSSDSRESLSKPK